MSTSTVGKPAPGLVTLRAAMRDWSTELRRLADKNKEHCAYIAAGGVSLPALVLRVFDKRKGDNVFNRTMEVLVWHTHGAEPQDSEAFVGEDTIRISVNHRTKKDAALPPAEVGDPPNEYIMRSHTVHCVSTTKMDMLDDLSPGQFVILNGVIGRTWLANADTPAPFWSISFDVGVIEPVKSMSLQSMWLAASGTGTDYLFPNDLVFDESQPNSRYNKDRTHFVSVHAAPTGDAEIAQREDRWVRECGETCLITKNWTSETWEIKEIQGRSRSMRAQLVLAHLQWPPRTEYREGLKEEILLGLSLYAEQLRGFGITDIDTWIVLAPLIFQRLSFKAIAYIDTKGTETNFGGVASDEQVDFALQLNGMALIPDLETCYRKIGVPVTADFVMDMPGAVRPAASASTNLVETLPPVVPVTGPSADPTIASALIEMATRGVGPEFRALINFNPVNAVFKGLATLDSEEGSVLVKALQFNDKGSLAGNDKLTDLYDIMATGMHVHVVVFAMCNDLVPMDVRSQRNASLMSYMTGKVALGAPAIEDGSAKPDEEEEGEGEEEDSQATDTDMPAASASASAAASAAGVKPSRKRPKKKAPVNKKSTPKKPRT